MSKEEFLKKYSRNIVSIGFKKKDEGIKISGGGIIVEGFFVATSNKVYESMPKDADGRYVAQIKNDESDEGKEDDTEDGEDEESIEEEYDTAEMTFLDNDVERGVCLFTLDRCRAIGFSIEELLFENNSYRSDMLRTSVEALN